ncbi:glycoside hydrolase family 15 protein [Paraburkholderia sp. SIMBA_027]|uniref:glycoside hydrolase family 15 protein n=1 Tax=Paraburkholderia sp. SIMBA_027 TaxID=3085770 RepID=UPI00397957FB
MASAIVRIERELNEGDFIRRLKAPVDGSAEGSFLACSCWLADCMSMQARHDDVRAQFERALAVRNDLGLLAEEYNVPGRHLSGNFPRALSHLALVETVWRLARPQSKNHLAKPDATHRPGNTTDADDNVSLF